jgi:hypothetical protein
VWAPTNYVVVRGLVEHGHDALAREAAANHLRRLVEVASMPPADASRISPEERDGATESRTSRSAPTRRST